MCGIAGSFGHPEAVLRHLLAAGRTRGPDHTGSVKAGPWRLGAARLRVTGGARGDQPLRAADGSRLVANAEVFNHSELGPREPGGSDLEPLLAALRVDPRAALERIRGPFALAFFDARTETLWLARDEWGVRPLFVVEDGDALAFGSQPRALAEATGATAPDEDAWDHLLAFQFLPPERSAFAGVEALPPGSWRAYRWTATGLRHEEGVFRHRGGSTRGLEALAEEAFRLQAPVERGPVGLTLSGGLDSGAVLGGLLRAGHRPDLAAVGWFPEGPPELDERGPARAAAEACGVPLLEVPITAAAYLEAWDETLRHLGGPIAGPGSVSQFLVARALAEAGVRVVFSGQGGDELFGGYERHRQLLARDLGLPPSPRPGYETLLGGAGHPAARLLFRGRELLPHLVAERARRVAARATELPADGPDLADRLLAFEARVLLPGLLHVDDATLGAHGLEGRVPLLDPALAAAVAAIPLAEKSPPAEPRRLFRRLFASCLPSSSAARRDKMGFPLPLDAWLAGPFAAAMAASAVGDALEELGLPDGARLLRRGDLRPRTRWFLLSAARARILAPLPFESAPRSC